MYSISIFSSFVRFISAAFLCLVLISCHAFSPVEPAIDPSADFRMIIRLWPHHHTDTVLRNELISALIKYRSACDEVWFCTELGVPPLDVHRRSAEAMKVAIRKMNEVHIKSSIQIGLSIGHGDGATGNFEGLRWGHAIGKEGRSTIQCSCPRQPEFLSYMAELARIYGACKPSTLWIDDDLRIALHIPVYEICYCPLCVETFSKQTGGNWNRQTLVEALDHAERNDSLRLKWIAFGQESLAGVARVIARNVHRVSPETRMGLQHYNGHKELLNGPDLSPIFNAMQEETGQAPASRPGSGFYNDHSPREMIAKGYDMARQIYRLPSYVTEIAAEVEGYQHWATGKSSYGMAVESFLYLAMGCNQLSYAVLCSAFEPMEWYASNYLKELDAWRPFYEEYVGFNRGTQPGGLLPYISKEQVLRPLDSWEKGWEWTMCSAGSMINTLAPLGLPFCPEGSLPSATIIDAEALAGMPETEVLSLLRNGRLLMGDGCLEILKERNLISSLKPVPAPDHLDKENCLFFETERHNRVARTSFNANISGAQRLNLLHVADWVSEGKLPVIVETMAQMQVIPRVDPGNRLKSVTLLNVSISKQEETTVRLRGCPKNKCEIVWKTQGRPNRMLPIHYDGQDVVVTVPLMDGWSIGWLCIRS